MIKKSIDRIRIDKFRKFSSKSSNSTQNSKGLAIPEHKLKINRLGHKLRKGDISPKTVKRSKYLGRLRLNKGNKLGSNNLSEGNYQRGKKGVSPGLQRVINNKRFFNLSKSK